MLLLHLPLNSPADLAALEGLVRGEDLLIHGGSLVGDGYSVASYLKSVEFESGSYKALFDRNLLSPLVGLMSGRQVPKDPGTAKVWMSSCACLAFCILSGIQVEPSMALYEYGSGKTHLDALGDFNLFRMADNADPRILVDIALGRSVAVPELHLDELRNTPGLMDKIPGERNFAKTLNIFNLQYMLVLKAAELLAESSKRLGVAMRLIDWQAEEGYFNGVATLFLWAALSHSPPKRRMLKGKTVSDLKNAAWDMALICQWGKDMRDDANSQWLLCSNDVALRHVANSVFVPRGASEDDAMLNFLVPLWGDRDGRALYKKYAAVASNFDSPERRERVAELYGKLSQEVMNLETRLGYRSENT